MMKFKKQQGKNEKEMDDVTSKIMEEHDAAVEELKNLNAEESAKLAKDVLEELDVDVDIDELIKEQKAWRKGYNRGIQVGGAIATASLGLGLLVFSKLK